MDFDSLPAQGVVTRIGRAKYRLKPCADAVDSASQGNAGIAVAIPAQWMDQPGWFAQTSGMVCAGMLTNHCSPALNSMKLITSAADLDEVRSLPRALVFIYVNWAIQARHSDVACRDFLAKLQRDYPNEEIPVYRVDLSEQEGEVWVAIRKWLKEEGQPHDWLSYGGYGAMLWVRAGAVAAYVPYLAEIECHKLMAMTRGVFELGGESGTSGVKPLQ